MHINTNGAWTLPEQIARLALEQPDGKALVEMDSDGGWLTTTWDEYWQTLRNLAKGLITLGVQPGEHIAMVGNNRRDWVICQMGISAATAVPAPIYVTNTIDQMAYITKHCEARIVICDNQQQLTKFLTAIERGLIELDHIITMDDLGSDHPMVIALADVISRGTRQADEELDRRMTSVKPDDLALLIYTSGTTGLPKGAMCTHRGIEAIGKTFLERFPQEQHTLPNHSISYLPLCHVAEQAFTNFVGLRSGNVTYFCSDMNKIRDYLVTVRPQYFFAVPRVWEKFEAAMRAKLSSATGIKAKLASWARRVEFDSAKRSMEKGTVIDSFQRRLANKLVIARIKSAIGFDRLYVAGAGAAPMSLSTLEFFASIGILIHEGLGMTETTGLATAQQPGMPRFGSVGQAFSCVEVKIADDGEILLRGDNMVPGYLHMPEASESLKNDDNWMYTGDLGTIDKDGYLTITGRKKDLLITAGGKNVAPR